MYHSLHWREAILVMLPHWLQMVAKSTSKESHLPTSVHEEATNDTNSSLQRYGALTVTPQVRGGLGSTNFISFAIEKSKLNYPVASLVEILQFFTLCGIVRFLQKTSLRAQLQIFNWISLGH